MSSFDHLFGTPSAADVAANTAYWAAHAAAEAARIAAHNAPAPRTMRPYCARCGGKGYLPSFSHIKGGACFACN